MLDEIASYCAVGLVGSLLGGALVGALLLRSMGNYLSKELVYRPIGKLNNPPGDE